MEYQVDVQNISETGFDKYLNRAPQTSTSTYGTIYTNPQTLTQGIIGENGILYLGSMQVRIDGKEQRILVNDGTNDVVLIGKF